MAQAVHREVAHKISLPLAIADCFPLFTPIGEMDWVPGWQPRFLWPQDGRTQKGMVFLTGQGSEETFWIVVDFDEAQHYARYARITPGSRSVLVEIQCKPTGPRETGVEVRYALTGHNEAANPDLLAFAAGFPAMIEEWRALILKWIDRKNSEA
jgi:hypothetical protein